MMRKRVVGVEDPIGVNTTDGIAGKVPNTKPRIACWKAITLAAVSLAALLTLLSLAWKTSYRDASQHSSWDYGIVVNEACHSYDAIYFKNLLNTVQQMPPSSPSTLCEADYLLHNTNCQCPNPLFPVPSQKVHNWQEIHQMNLDLIQTNYTARNIQPDLVLYGDSLTERLLGNMFGKSGPKMKEYAKITQQLFTTKGGGAINGLPLGISSDAISHLLYRLQNGELPSSLQPKVWWVLIGTNDAKLGCSVDVIVAGNLRIVQELQQHNSNNNHPKIPIVINSLLPRGAQVLNAPRNTLWRILSRVNQQLACYAAITPGVYFANVTDQFIIADNNGKVFIHPDMYVKDNLHISTNGSRVWEEYMVERVLSLLG